MMICDAKNVVSGIADILFPPECAVCGAILTGSGNDLFCSGCLSMFNLISPPLCTACGAPFAYTGGTNHLCEDCIVSRPSFSMARAVGKYDAALLDAIHLFKYHGKISAGKALGKMMAQTRYDSLAIENYSTIMPVPLHARRLRERGFNQSLILAKQISDIFSLPLDFLTLRRKTRTEAQVSLSRKERASNVRGAFEVTDIKAVENKRILLIDDVYTTGSTVKECSKTLMKNGAAEVAVLTLSRA